MNSIDITISNPTPNSPKIAYYMEFVFGGIDHNCEFYRDGSRQIGKFANNKSRVIKGTVELNTILDGVLNGAK